MLLRGLSYAAWEAEQMACRGIDDGQDFSHALPEVGSAKACLLLHICQGCHPKRQIIASRKRCSLVTIQAGEPNCEERQLQT